MLICENLFLFMFICENFSLFMLICENFFYYEYFWGDISEIHFLRE